ncbi:phage holin family protein [Modestobacter sp. SSW1-42]|uniref:phage holin family protein n=1 Tax=Modestobacter sp. SSW1-42 TaxID=596372 RepID=UPI0039864853
MSHPAGGPVGGGATPYGQPSTGYTQSGATGYAPPPNAGEYDAQHNQAQYLDDQPMTADGHPDVEGTSVGTLISEVTRDLSTLMRQEVELAKAEIKAEANKATAEVKAQTGKAGKGVGMLVGAGVAGLMVAVFLSCAIWWGLENVMDAGLAALIVTVLWVVIAAVLASMGRKQLKTIDFSRLKQLNPKPEQTVETLQQVPGALKPN